MKHAVGVREMAGVLAILDAMTAAVEQQDHGDAAADCDLHHALRLGAAELADAAAEHAEILCEDGDRPSVDARGARDDAVGRRSVPRVRLACFRLFRSERADLIERAGIDELCDPRPRRHAATFGKPLHCFGARLVDQLGALVLDRFEDLPLSGVWMEFHDPLCRGSG